jgi:AraC-like DNA-binding protein
MLESTCSEHINRVLYALDYLEKDPLQDVSLEEAAKSAGYSLYHFFPVFKNIVGITPKEYLRRRRMTLAAHELLSGKVSIQTLAYHLQYDNPKPFARAFKKQYGVNPSSYRKRSTHLWQFDQSRVTEGELLHVNSASFQTIAEFQHFPTPWISGFASFNNYDNNYLMSDFIEWQQMNYPHKTQPYRGYWGNTEETAHKKNWSGFFAPTQCKYFEAGHNWNVENVKFHVFYHRGSDEEYLYTIEQLWRRAMVGLKSEPILDIPVILIPLDGASKDNPLREIQIWMPVVAR